SLLTLREGNFIFQAFEGLLAGILVNVSNDVLSKVQHTIQVAARNIEQQAQIRGDATGIPDMRHRCRQTNMAHTLAADSSPGHFDAALIANDAFITGVFIFTAVTLPVASGSKDGFTEQTILLRPQPAIVDCFGFKNFTVRPTANGFRRSQANTKSR